MLSVFCAVNRRAQFISAVCIAITWHHHCHHTTLQGFCSLEFECDTMQVTALMSMSRVYSTHSSQLQACILISNFAAQLAAAWTDDLRQQMDMSQAGQGCLSRS